MWVSDAEALGIDLIVLSAALSRKVKGRETLAEESNCPHPCFPRGQLAREI